MNLQGLTILETKKLLQGKQVSALELAQDLLHHIGQTDPKIGSYLYVDKEGVLKEAEARDKAGLFDLPLAGVPIAVKDVIATVAMPTTAGSKILQGYLSPYDATVVTKLHQAGAIIVGKTNLDEFAMGSSTENSAYQKTVNPWDHTRIPGGSGGGSAAAVAADLAVAALGTDTGGSIRQPAAFTGTVGLKPTYGRVSRYGIVALASSLDQVGPVTKNVSDAAALLNIISGLDNSDATSLPAPVPDYLKNLDKLDLKKMRIGLPIEYFGSGVDAEILRQVKEVAKKLQQLGADVVEVSLPNSEQALSVYYVIMPSEASSNLARYDGIRFGKRHSGKDVLDIYLKTRAAGFGDEPKRRIVLGTYALSTGYYEAFYQQAVAARQAVRQDFDNVFKRVDLLIAPTTPTTAFKFGEMSSPLAMYMNDILTIPSNLAGNTAISIPIGLAAGLPVGLQIIGPHLAEEKLLQLAKKIEDIVEWPK